LHRKYLPTIIGTEQGLAKGRLNLLSDIILGIDPGTLRAGYGLIRITGDNIEHVDHGIIRMKDSWSLPERLKVLQARLHELFGQYPVQSAVVEKIFFGKNADSAFKLGHARGVCLLVAAQHGVEVEEYAARFVKKAVTGSGAASKEHVQKVIFNLLRISAKELSFDASDALSLAVTHARVRDANRRLKKALEGSP
jgi:crossover junction endodeoxyribonuclease RuvC